MSASNNKDLKIEIGLDEGKEWSDEQFAEICAWVKMEADKRSPERILKNELLSIQYQMRMQ